MGDERVVEGFGGGDALVGIEREHAFEKVDEVRDLLALGRGGGRAASAEGLFRVDLDALDGPRDHLLREQVLLLETKLLARVVCKVLEPKLCLLDHLLRKCPLDIHHELEHFVVGATREEDLAGEELVDDAADAPHVQRVVVGEAEDDLGRAVEAAHEVRCDGIVS